MRVADGVEMLELAATAGGRRTTIYPTVLWDDAGLTLIDTGFPGPAGPLLQAIEGGGLAPDRLRRVILTHQDIDHTGGLPALAAAVPGPLEVLATGPERPYIEGERQLLKITPEAIEGAVRGLPATMPEAARQAFRAALERPPRHPVHALLSGGQALPWSGGIVVVDTPGHTPGHISLYHRTSRTLVAGDALMLVDGKLVASPPALSWDGAMARRSLGNLGPYDIGAVICYHGGLFRGAANGRIAELADAPAL